MSLKNYSILFCAVLLVFLSLQRPYAQVNRETLRQIEMLLQEKKQRTPVEQKIDSRLLQAVKEKLGVQIAKGADLEPANVNADKLGNLAVDIRANVSDELLVKIEKLGGKIIFPSAEYRTIRATINLSMVKTIAAYPEVLFIEPAAEAETIGAAKAAANAKAGRQTVAKRSVSLTAGKAAISNQLISYLQSLDSPDPSVTGTEAAPVISEGDRTHRADNTRNIYGYSGEGIKIGVLSNSYNAKKAAAANIASGDLPGAANPLGNKTAVTVVQDYSLNNPSDEGRAMMQIVHDLVPKAKLYFATANVSEAGFASNIKKLRFTYGCDIIIDDVSYYDEPAFQDGIVAQAVNSVTANGALYFASAGNAGSLAKGTSGVYEGDFSDAGSLAFGGGSKNGTIHNFGTVSSPVNGDIITVQGNVYNLDWSDPIGGSSNDYDLFLVRTNGTVKASSTNVQNGTQNPYEQISTRTLVAGDRLLVFKTTAAQKRAFRINTNRGALTIGTNGQTRGHACAIAAFGVAATPAATSFGSPGSPVGPYPNPFSAANQTETFTSDGPRRIFFNADTTPVTPGNFLFATNGGTNRAKPDVTAADGVATTFAGSTGLNPFFGTSAAAPHAGAIAALLKSADPTLTPAQIRTLLTSTAVDIEASGYDNISGYGIVQAYQAMQALSPVPFANVTLDSVGAGDGATSNHNGIIDPYESGSIVVKIKNVSLVAATAVKGTLTSPTPGVTITKNTATFGTIGPNGGFAKNTATPYTFKLDSSITCGAVLEFFLTVNYGGGKSPSRVFRFTVNVGAQPYRNLVAALGSPVSGATYTVATGTQKGRLSRGTDASVCGSLLPNPGILTSAGLDLRKYDAYTFTNTSSISQCVTTIMNADSGLNLYCVAYNDSGFVPASPNKHFLADPGQSATTQAYSFDVAAGKSFTIVVHEVNSGTLTGTPYALSVSLSNCSGPGARMMGTAEITAKALPAAPASDLTISPNPASTYVTVYSKTGMKQIQLLSPAGQLLRTIIPDGNSYRLGISGLASGQYFLRIETAAGVINQKFIKQ